MPIERSSRSFRAGRIGEVARRLLGAAPLCAIATASPGGRPHVHTAYFAVGPDLRIVWISDPRARHSLNLASNPSAAAAVFDSRQRWGGPDRGIQLFGDAGRATGSAAESAARVYAGRFPGYRPQDMPGYMLFELHPRRIKLFDETELGAGTFVTATVRSGGRVEWVRTEVYRAG